MREPAPNYRRDHYERPNQPWVCGLASEGQACPAGPGEHGHCPALAECVPARDGDRWKCNRSALRGGVCGEGPTPEGGCSRVNRCEPVRSLRAVRGRFVLASALAATGGLLILLSADWRNAAISPGPLARQHAQLLESEPSGENCAACHAAAERSAAGWTASLVAGHGDRADQTRRCMECHEKTIAAEFARAAHGMPPEALRQISAGKMADPSWVGQATTSEEMKVGGRRTRPGWSGYVWEGRAIGCATCHREHQGAEFDLTAMNDAACQSCHQRRYESFGADHPDFGAWPYERRTRIAFNHASHRRKHFAEKKQAFDCRLCHVDDATGQVQLLASYEAACASCHDEKIATSAVQGVPMFALPTLDVAALKAAGHNIGRWPDAASGDFDGRLPPAMKLLLAADPAAARAIATLGEDFEFLDVDPDDDEQLKASAELAAAIRALMLDIARRGPIALRERFAASLERNVSDAELRAITAGLSADTVRGTVQTWFPGEDAGSAAWGGILTGIGGADPTTANRESKPAHAFAPAGTWKRDDARFELRYQPAAHADPVLTSLLELLTATPKLAEKPLALAMFKELAKPMAPGSCTSCHSVEQAAGEELTINWQAYDRTTEPRGFTKFAHGPHLLLPQLADCTQCHAIDESRDASASYADWNPQAFVSEFAPLSKQRCVECHTAKAAGEACQKCHNYHVEAIESWRAR